MFITVDLMSDDIRIYKTQKEATEHSIAINQRIEEHPAFHLFKVMGNKKKVKFLGRLTRDFGRAALYWDKEYYEDNF